MMRKFLNGLVLFLLMPLAVQANDSEKSTETRTYNNTVGVMQNLADPFVFKHDGVYYLYGTRGGGNTGIVAYKSDDMINWGKPAGATNGFALHKDEVWGDKWFWSPEVVYHNNKFYMIYTVEEYLAVATSDSPLGPFTQPKPGPLNPGIKEIGHKTLFDNGRVYIYFSRFDRGNVIFGAQMSDDLLSMKEETVTRLIDATEDWEHTDTNPDQNWPVAEAPFPMKHEGTYYLFYTANHFRSPDYAVGYATASRPLGPYKKYEHNPILKSTKTIKGTGTTAITTAPNGDLYMFYHAHYSPEKVGPRKTLMDKVEFFDQPGDAPDVVKVDGPTTTTQKVDW